MMISDDVFRKNERDFEYRAVDNPVLTWYIKEAKTF